MPGFVLVGDIENFGEIRGSHAHQSAKAVQSVLDPETEYNRMTSLVAELAGFDEWLMNYKRRIR